MPSTYRGHLAGLSGAPRLRASRGSGVLETHLRRLVAEGTALRTRVPLRAGGWPRNVHPDPR